MMNSAKPEEATLNGFCLNLLRSMNFRKMCFLSVNTADLVTLQKYLHGRSGITKSNSVLADTCCDGVTDVLDMVTLRRKVINELA